MDVVFITSSIKESRKKILTEILSNTTVFNIDNNKKYFLSSKSAY